MGSRNREHLIALATVAIGALIYVALSQTALQSAPLLDDYAIINTLSAFSSPIDSFVEWRALITSSASGPTGRPISMASFALLHEGGRADYSTLLTVNMGLHVLIGFVAFWLISTLFAVNHTNGVGQATHHGLIIASLVALLWLLHPLHISTTFYLVQRMSQLSTLFVLLAIICYIYARTHLLHERLLVGLSLLTVSALMTLIGFLAKENALLVPIGLLSIELCIFRRKPNGEAVSPDTAKYAQHRLFLWLTLIPSFLIISYLTWPLLDNPYSSNVGGTVLERLMTQARVIWSYIADLWIPRSQTRGLFHENYPLSQSILTPPSTLFAIAGIIALLASAQALLKKAPMISLGILWFIGFHLLESTTVPLELYFEHRNYLPSMGLALVFAECLRLGVSGISQARTRVKPWLLVISVGSIVIATLSVQLSARATHWADPLQAAERWAQSNPYSVRAWQTLAQRSHLAQQSQKVLFAVQQWQALAPQSTLALLAQVSYQCARSPLSTNSIALIQKRLQEHPIEETIASALRLLWSQREFCTAASANTIERWVQTALKNPQALASESQQLHDLAGDIAITNRDVLSASNHYQKAWIAKSDDKLVNQQAIKLWRAGYANIDAWLTYTSQLESHSRSHGRLHAYHRFYSRDKEQKKLLKFIAEAQNEPLNKAK